MHLTGFGYTRVDPTQTNNFLNTRRRDNTLEGAPFTSQPICLLHAAVQVEKQRAVRERLQQANTGKDEQMHKIKKKKRSGKTSRKLCQAVPNQAHQADGPMNINVTIRVASSRWKKDLLEQKTASHSKT